MIFVLEESVGLRKQSDYFFVFVYRDFRECLYSRRCLETNSETVESMFQFESLAIVCANIQRQNQFDVEQFGQRSGQRNVRYCAVYVRLHTGHGLWYVLSSTER